MNEKIIAELREWMEEIKDWCSVPDYSVTQFNKILSRLSAEQGADKGEPLEELAKRKGFIAAVDVQILDKDLLPEANFDDSTKARAYLLALPEVDGKGREGK